MFPVDQQLDTDERLSRYSRHILLSGVDIEGQQKLLNSSVLIIGLGGLGAISSQYLAASGVGHLTIVDPDVVELSNLQRQIIHNTNTIGMSKVDSAKRRLQELNPDVRVIALQQRFEEALFLSSKGACLAKPRYDLALDCTDNYQTRLQINAACMRHKIPLIIGSAIEFSGQLLVVDSRQQAQPCYQCLYRDQPVVERRCSEMGVLSPLLGVMGSFQAVEAIKCLLGYPMRTGALWLYDALSETVSGEGHSANVELPIESIRFSRWADCPHH